MGISKEKKRAYNKAYYERRKREDPSYTERHRERARNNNPKYKQRNKDLFAEFRDQGCKYCDETEHCCLQAHHRDPEQKEFDPSRGVHLGYGLERLKKELAKCDCVCANCHAKIHAGLLTPDECEG